jgi:competence protein ComEC
MVWLVCAAIYTGRPVSPFNLLAASALVVVAMNPADLFRIGPQLSFLAVATLAWVGPRLARRPTVDPLERLIAESRPWMVRALHSFGKSTRRFLLITAGVWLVSLPLVLARFHIVSPAALWLTPLLTLPISVGLIAGFVLVTFGWLIWPLSIPLAWVCEGSLAIVSKSIAACDHIPLSHVWLPGPSWWWLVGGYGTLAVWAASARLRPPRRWCLGILAGWTAIGLFVARIESSPRPAVDCTFLSVGHGCATVLELPDGTTLLYDAGQLGSPTAAARSVSSFLWSRGRTHIDAVIISHSDVDHYNALPELLRRFSVGVVYVSPVMFDAQSAATETLRHAIERAGVPMREIFAGDRLRTTPECRIEVLHPPRRGTLGSDNSNSIVLKIEYRGRRLLLPGDLESPGLDELLAEIPLDCDIVLAPHHGSTRSDPPGFAAWTTPDWVVISGDNRSTRPQVAAAYSQRGATVLNTSQTGAVTAAIDAQGVHVSTHRRNASRKPTQPSVDLDVDDEQGLVPD